MKYEVELVGLAPVRYFMEVEAEDEQNAKQYAVERAPTSRPGLWDVQAQPDVTHVRIISIEELGENC